MTLEGDASLCDPPFVRTVILSSGSQGNVTLVEGGSTRLLIDAGISVRAVRGRMGALGMDADIDGVVITHSHSDHAQHLARYAAAFKVPITLTRRTYEELELASKSLDAEFHFIESSQLFRVGDIEVVTLPLPHDAPQIALKFRCRGDTVALVTDLGHVPSALHPFLRDVRTLLLESNHDPALLAAGSYPHWLKRRVGGTFGHLSNEQAAGVLRKLSPTVERVVLMHLSESNNSEALAYRVARAAIKRPHVELMVAQQNSPIVLDDRPPAQLALF